MHSDLICFLAGLQGGRSWDKMPSGIRVGKERSILLCFCIVGALNAPASPHAYGRSFNGNISAVGHMGVGMRLLSSSSASQENLRTVHLWCTLGQEQLVL